MKKPEFRFIFTRLSSGRASGRIEYNTGIKTGDVYWEFDDYPDVEVGYKEFLKTASAMLPNAKTIQIEMEVECR